MQQSDDLVIVFEYCGKDGSITRRVVSPIRFVASDRFLGLCLSREEPRQFHLSQCRNVRVDLAMNYTMPVELECIQPRIANKEASSPIAC
jgi:predicted DNA-binding transcriptional regulator YafY